MDNNVKKTNNLNEEELIDIINKLEEEYETELNVYREKFSKLSEKYKNNQKKYLYLLAEKLIIILNKQYAQKDLNRIWNFSKKENLVLLNETIQILIKRNNLAHEYIHTGIKITGTIDITYISYLVKIILDNKEKIEPQKINTLLSKKVK